MKVTTGTSNPSPPHPDTRWVVQQRLQQELTARLGRIMEDLDLTLRNPLGWEAGALLTAAAALERAAARLAEVDLNLQERLAELRRQRIYLVRKAAALRAAGREALPADGHQQV